MPDDPHNLQKYEELYRLTKEGLQAEEVRSKDLDEKAARYLTFLTVVAGFSVFALPGLAATLRPLEGVLDWLAIVVSALLVIIIVVAAGITLSVFAVQAWIVIPMNEELVEYFIEYRYMDILYSLACGNIKAILENRERVNKRKARKLRLAYGFVFAALVLAVVATATATVAVILSPGMIPDLSPVRR
jgi:uncharacterized protein involved in cysteine biosynthesis